jgi:MFS family permease
MFARLKATYHEFPRQFWAVVAVMFIDRVGGTMLFPFFSLYITQKFNVGMTEAGIVLGIFSIFGMVGSMIGGALSDKFGRRSLIIFGLVFSALSSLSLGLVNSLAVLYPLAVLVGLLSDFAHPAHQAMIADLLPEKQRPEGFGILRVVGNMAWIIGPTIGGFVANRSFFMLFVADATISSIVAVLFYLFIRETKPQVQDGSPQQQEEGILKTLGGYGRVLSDLAFTAFIFAAMLMGMVYIQMYNSLSVYLRDYHQISTQGYGFLLTTSAVAVILFQFSITRRIKHFAPFLMMGLGTLFYMVGFSMFGFDPLHLAQISFSIFHRPVTMSGSYFWFLLAIIVITTGEMVIMPTSQALAANFAPEQMRGRYMAVFGLAWALPAAVAPASAGLILDNLDPNLLWYGGGLLCAVSAFSYYLLHLRLGRQKRFIRNPQQEEPALETS